MTITIFPFTTPANYNYPADIEVAGGFALLKSLKTTGAKFASTFTAGIDGVWGDGVLTGVPTGGASVSGGKLDLRGGTTQYVTYDGVSNAEIAQVGAIKWRYTPNYSGTPASRQHFYSASQVPNGVKNLLSLFHDASSGNISILCYSSSSTPVVTGGFGTWSPTAGQEYELELNIDITTGATRLFIDGVQFGATKTQTGTRDSDTGFFRIGDYYTTAPTGLADHQVNDLLIFDTVQHTANYTPGYSISETIYSTANPLISPVSNVTLTELEAFAATIVAAGLDTVRFTLIVAGVETWWNGATWTTSSGYAESNTASDILANASSVVSARMTLGFNAYLHSEDGSTTPQLDSVTITFDEALVDPSTTTLVNLEGFIFEAGGPLIGAQVRMRPYEAGWINDGIFQAWQYQTIATTVDGGYFSGHVYFQPATKFWELKVGSQSYKMELLDQPEMDLKDAPTFEAIFT